MGCNTIISLPVKVQELIRLIDKPGSLLVNYRGLGCTLWWCFNFGLLWCLRFWWLWLLSCTAPKAR